MNYDSQKEHSFYEGAYDLPVDDGSSANRDLLRMAFNGEDDTLDIEDVWYLLGAYTRHVMAGGEPFLNKVDNGDDE